jgi:16S rRNA (uracil1498-N3)-methyltransferase
LRIPRFVVDQLEVRAADSADTGRPQEIILRGKESHHLRKVLRLEAGAALEVHALSTAGSYLCHIIGYDDEAVVCQIDRLLERRLPAPVVLIAAWVSPAQCDFVVEKAIEVGVRDLHFFSAQRSQERLKGERLRKRTERLERVAHAAMKQSGAAFLPGISLHSDLKSALDRLHSASPDSDGTSSELRILLQAPRSPAAASGADAADSAQDPEIKDLISVLRQGSSPPRSALEKLPASVDSFIVSGPEGGFTADELSLTRRFGYCPASLGPNVLRAETAAVLALGVVQLFWFSTTEGR